MKRFLEAEEANNSPEIGDLVEVNLNDQAKRMVVVHFEIPEVYIFKCLDNGKYYLGTESLEIEFYASEPGFKTKEQAIKEMHYRFKHDKKTAEMLISALCDLPEPDATTSPEMGFEYFEDLDPEQGFADDQEEFLSKEGFKLDVTVWNVMLENPDLTPDEAHKKAVEEIAEDK